jgi:hypothetical protein
MRGNIDTRLVNSGSSDSGKYKRNKGTAAGERIWIEETQKLYTRTHTATLTFTIHPVEGQYMKHFGGKEGKKSFFFSSGLR